MNDPQIEPPEDPWLTVAEFAEAMRVRPVTVRSWIAKGQLRATRGGQRKWLVRRSEVARMLEQGTEPSPSPSPPPHPAAGTAGPDEIPEHVLASTAEEAVRRSQEEAEIDCGSAVYEWDVVIEQSRMAPPDARFPFRIRQIAQAAALRATTMRAAIHDAAFEWQPVPGSAGMTLSYELRPGGNRPGPRDAWDRFDRVVRRLGAAMEGDSASAVASALHDLAAAMRDVADAIEHRPTRPIEPGDPDELAGPNDG